MRFRTWPVAALGLVGLLAVVALTVLVATRRAREIYDRVDQLNAHHRDVDAKLRRLRSDVHLSGIFVRDYLLDTDRERASETRQRLTEFRTNNMATVAELEALASAQDMDADRIARLQYALEAYWGAFEPLFDWTPVEKQTLSAPFLRRKVIPLRDAALTIARQIEELNNGNLEAQRTEVERQYAAFSSELHTLLWRSLVLGSIVTLVAVARLRVLERRSEDARAASEDAERQLRTLSQQLVATQEQERKKLSRELHDHVGQLLTALRLEIGRVDRLRGTGQPAGAGTAIAECRQIVDNLVRVVRDLALGLRPSMLDDLGLEPALEWLVRDVARRSGVAIELKVDLGQETAPEPYRTCIYRVVQEALTNCVRHAQAARAIVRVAPQHGGVQVSVTDDGLGFDPARRTFGLGLQGMEERVKELQGRFSVRRAGDRGTAVSFWLPAGAAATPPSEERVARLAG
jgi:signal transduction histidine kinase